MAGGRLVHWSGCGRKWQAAPRMPGLGWACRWSPWLVSLHGMASTGGYPTHKHESFLAQTIAACVYGRTTVLTHEAAPNGALFPGCLWLRRLSASRAFIKQARDPSSAARIHALVMQDHAGRPKGGPFWMPTHGFRATEAGILALATWGAYQATKCF